MLEDFSNLTNIQFVSLDGVIHVKDRTDKEWGNRRRNDSEINQIFEETISKENWIIEDAGRDIFEKGMLKADVIINLNPSMKVKKYRVIKRYVKQKLSIEKCLYTPSLKMVRFMYFWLKKFSNDEDGLVNRLKKYNEKVIVLKSNKDIKDYLSRIKY